jgi:uncharacterized protein (TIGR02246 family)
MLKNMKLFVHATCIIMLAILCNCESQPNQSAKTDEAALRKVNENYVKFWLAGDKDGVLSLFTDNSALSPDVSAPVKGMEAIEQFWFPNDSSVSTILKFTNDVVNVGVYADVAHTTQETFLSWSYKKGDLEIKKDQWGIALTVYHRQQDGSWKIWRQHWTDVRVEDRL